jgi:RimJ/RimL family protein N-acetyltransferase
LLIRPFKREDWHDLYAYTSNPEVWRFLSSEPYTKDDARRYVNDAVSSQERANALFDLAIVLKANDHMIGHMSFRVYNQLYRTREIGWVVSPFFQNQGYATEAAAALLNYGFGSLNLHRVVADCDTRNVASFRVMERLGMRREGHFVKNTLIRGEWQDQYSYAILEEEWRHLTHPGA